MSARPQRQTRSLRLLASPLIMLLGTGAAVLPLATGSAMEVPAQADVEDAAEDDAEACRQVEAYLRKAYPDRTWESGPSRVDSPVIRAAYGTTRFYRVYSQEPPFPYSGIPVSPDSPRQVEYREALTAFRQTKLSVTVRREADGQFHVLNTAADYGTGLLPLRTDDDFRTATAAILTLHAAHPFGALTVPPEKVQVRHFPQNLPPSSTTEQSTSAFAETSGVLCQVTFDRKRKPDHVTRVPLHLPPRSALQRMGPGR